MAVPAPVGDANLVVHASHPVDSPLCDKVERDAGRDRVRTAQKPKIPIRRSILYNSGGAYDTRVSTLTPLFRSRMLLLNQPQHRTVGCLVQIASIRIWHRRVLDRKVGGNGWGADQRLQTLGPYRRRRVDRRLGDTSVWLPGRRTSCTPVGSRHGRCCSVWIRLPACPRDRKLRKEEWGKTKDGLVIVIKNLERSYRWLAALQ